MSVMRVALRARPGAVRALHTSRVCANLPRSPFAAFVDTLREQLANVVLELA